MIPQALMVPAQTPKKKKKKTLLLPKELQTRLPRQFSHLNKKDDQFCIDNVQKANLLNEQFQSDFTPKSPLTLKQLSSQKVQDLQESGHISPESVPTEIKNKYHSVQEINISVGGIMKLLQGLKPDKASGSDRIKPLLLHKLCCEIALILQVIFSKSLQKGSLPSDWLKANAVPVFKKCDKTCPASYRPISLTCILCKLLEHIVAFTVVKHLDQNKILYDLQYGFRAKRSCETQLTMLIEELHQNLKELQ